MRTMMRRVATLVAGGLVATAAIAGAQEVGVDQLGGGTCGTVYDSCGGDNYGHTFPGGVGVNGGTGHTECMWCYSGGVVTDPLACHGACTAMVPAAERKEYAALLAAGAKGDVDAILALGRVIPDYVSYNPDRAAVQVQSCDKLSVIATIKLVTPTQVRLAAALPERKIDTRWTLTGTAAGDF